VEDYITISETIRYRNYLVRIGKEFIEKPEEKLEPESDVEIVENVDKS
jgi:hypothetical protein